MFPGCSQNRFVQNDVRRSPAALGRVNTDILLETKEAVVRGLF